jgi:hypothetical protein
LLRHRVSPRAPPQPSTGGAGRLSGRTRRPPSGHCRHIFPPPLPPPLPATSSAVWYSSAARGGWARPLPRLGPLPTLPPASWPWAPAAPPGRSPAPLWHLAWRPPGSPPRRVEPGAPRRPGGPAPAPPAPADPHPAPPARTEQQEAARGGSAGRARRQEGHMRQGRARACAAGRQAGTHVTRTYACYDSTLIAQQHTCFHANVPPLLIPPFPHHHPFLTHLPLEPPAPAPARRLT